jgi:hypothetical protein
VRTAGYRARVQAASLNRWAVVILLVTRLVLGEFAHAHDGAHASANAGSQESSHCHDDAQQPGKSDCCKTGGCECPCPFGTAATGDVTFFLALATEVVASDSFIHATPDRPFTLFRPPA